MLDSLSIKSLTLKLKYYYLQQSILFTFIFAELNDILLEKLMPTLQPICGGQSHIKENENKEKKPLKEFLVCSLQHFCKKEM